MEKRYKKTHKKGVKRNIDNTLDGQIRNKFNYKRQMACNLACMYEILDGMTGEYYQSELYHVSTSDMYNIYTIKDKNYIINFTDKYNKVCDCGKTATFRRPDDWKEFPHKGASEDGWLLHEAYFCKDRLCPMCSWRRSIKIFSQICSIMDVIEDKYDFLFLTLTVPNCTGYDLPETIDNLQYGFRRLLQMKKFKNAVKGYFKALEVTISKKRFCTAMYHPHYHVILAVDKSYFKGNDYVSQAEFLRMWRKAMKNDEITQVDIRKVRPKEDDTHDDNKSYKAAVAEVAKYTTKSTDYILNSDLRYLDNWFLIPSAKKVLDLTIAFQDRRLCSFGGCFSDARKNLKLDDCEDGDLVHVTGENIRDDVGYMIRTYNWNIGASIEDSFYELVEERHEVNLDISCEDDPLISHNQS